MRAIINWPGHRWTLVPARLYLGFVFLYACAHKIADPGAFALDVATYQVLPLALVNVAALALPWIELFAGVMIVLGFRVRAAALLITAMMIVFMVGLSWALHLGLDMSCGCFASSSDEDPISAMTLVRDAGWLLLALYVLAFDRGQSFGIDRWRARNQRSAGPPRQKGAKSGNP